MAFEKKNVVVKDQGVLKKVPKKDPDPKKGVVISDSWDKILPDISLTKEDLSKSLLKVGVLTVEDALANPRKVHLAIQTTSGATLATVLNASRKYKKKKKK